MYNETCANTGPTGLCYNDNVIGSGANYADAYFEIAYLRAYTTVAPGTAPTAVVGALANQDSSAEPAYRRAPNVIWQATAWIGVVLLCVLGGGLSVL